MKTIAQRLNEPNGMAIRLRALRVEAAMSGKDLAAAAGWAASKVTRIEHGQQAPTVRDIEIWVQACGVPSHTAVELIASLRALHAEHASWRLRMRSGPVAAQTAYNKTISEARSVRFFESAVVPGMLQTAPYARRVLAEVMQAAGIKLDDLNHAVAVRMQRQQMLYDAAKQFEFLLAEPVLRWRICPPEIMRAQLDRLHSAIGLSNVRFGILPYSAAQTVLPINAFQICDDIATVETFAGEITYRGADVRTYSDALDSLWAHAVEGEAARRIITEVVTAH